MESEIKIGTRVETIDGVGTVSFISRGEEITYTINLDDTIHGFGCGPANEFWREDFEVIEES